MEGTELLLHVVDCLVECANRAGSTIRHVQKGREENVDEFKVMFKDEDDSKSALTLADMRAQMVILDHLHTKFPGISVIGEEDEEDTSGWKIPSFASSPPVVDVDALKQVAPKEYDHIKMEDLVVFIDPVDGTREFVEGRLDACQTLLGVAWRGRPIAGVVGLPFHDQSVGKFASAFSRASGVTFYGIVGIGLFGLPEKIEEGHKYYRSKEAQEKLVLAISQTTKEPALLDTRATLEKASLGRLQTLKAGGCGNKVLRLLVGQADAAVFNLGTSLWDTCATCACLGAIGGKMTTLFGTPIEHSTTVPKENIYGVLASTRRLNEFKSHDDIMFVMRGLPSITKLFPDKSSSTDEPEALDLIRSVNGVPFTADDLTKLVFPNGENVVESFVAPERETVRYKQSHACRIHLKTKTPCDIKSVFYKRMVLRELPYSVYKYEQIPYKLVRDIRSYCVESEFLASSACQAFQAENANGVQLAMPYRIEQKIYNDVTIDSRFSSLLYDFAPSKGWKQYAHLKERELKLALKSLASFHGFFSNKKELFQGKVWEHGSYWHLGQQPSDQLSLIEANWTKLCDVFGEHLQGIFDDQESLQVFGKRLHEESIKASEIVHGLTADSRNPDHITLIHGDPKSPNFFFLEDEEKVGLIDFQWCGFGLPAVDVAYCIAASMDRSIEDVEPFVEHYYNCLSASPFKEVPSRAEFQTQFEHAFIDLTRVVVADHWKTITLETFQKRENQFVFNAYNKSLDVALVLVKTCAKYLKLAR